MNRSSFITRLFQAAATLMPPSPKFNLNCASLVSHFKEQRDFCCRNKGCAYAALDVFNSINF